MAQLPLQHKQQIQFAYVRYCELVKEIPEVDLRVTMLQSMQWGGIAVVIAGTLGLESNFMGTLVRGTGIILAFAGWISQPEHKKRQKLLESERRKLIEQMEALGVSFDHDPERDRVAVYAGPISHQNAVSPMQDSSYC